MKNLRIIFFAKCSGLENIAGVKIKRTNQQLSGLSFLCRGLVSRYKYIVQAGDQR